MGVKYQKSCSEQRRCTLPMGIDCLHQSVCDQVELNLVSLTCWGYYWTRTLVSLITSKHFYCLIASTKMMVRIIFIPYQKTILLLYISSHLLKKLNSCNYMIYNIIYNNIVYKMYILYIIIIYITYNNIQLHLKTKLLSYLYSV